jgi:hypothetical protein
MNQKTARPIYKTPLSTSPHEEPIRMTPALRKRLRKFTHHRLKEGVTSDGIQWTRYLGPESETYIAYRRPGGRAQWYREKPFAVLTFSRSPRRGQSRVRDEDDSGLPFG